MNSTRSKGSKRPTQPLPEAAAAVVPDLEIHGSAARSIHYVGNVTVGPRGAVAGGIHARTIVVAGEVRGNLHAEEAVRILAGARVTGDVHAPRVAIDGAARLQGRLAMRRRPEAPAVTDDAAVDALLSGQTPR